MNTIQSDVDIRIRQAVDSFAKERSWMQWKVRDVRVHANPHVFGRTADIWIVSVEARFLAATARNRDRAELSQSEHPSLREAASELPDHIDQTFRLIVDTIAGHVIDVLV